MINRIKSLCNKHKTNFSQLEKELGFANGSIAKSDEKIQAVRLKAIADYFGVSMEYFFSGSNLIPYPLTNFEMHLIEAYRKADEISQGAIDRLLHIEEKKKEAVLLA